MSPQRRQLLNDLRARQNREWSARSPTERLERADELRSLAHVVRSAASLTDEPRELLIALRARRKASARP